MCLSLLYILSKIFLDVIPQNNIDQSGTCFAAPIPTKKKVVLTGAETDDCQVELKSGIDLLGHVDDIFFDTCDRIEPINQHDVENCFISSVVFGVANIDRFVKKFFRESKSKTKFSY
ncbi:GDP dissociation inhibitor [Parasponia andersonii]|uniref:GDP dissociation inhibitor n=1 Tax=Parasponia andersonii TaxID=3476 RepID=A0A2P5BG75_PARAD|nr:GDP dissociation inhibitor [Parasponia andersonii]